MKRLPFALSLAAAVAPADGPAKELNKPIIVTMARARADYDRHGRLVWSYRVAGSSWRMLKQRRVPAFVDMYTVRVEGGRERKVFRYRQWLRREGKVWLNPNALEGWQSADFQIVGAMAESFIEGMTINGQFKAHSRWKLRGAADIAPAPPPAPPPAGATYAQIVQTCNRYFMFRRDRIKCVQIGKQLRPAEALETIRTCAKAHHFRSERFKCLRRAPRRQSD